MLEKMLGTGEVWANVGGAEFRMRSIHALSLREFSFVMSRGAQFARMSDEEIQQRRAEVLRTLDEIFLVIAPTLPRFKPFFWQRWHGGYIPLFALPLNDALALLQVWIEQQPAREENGTEETGNEPADYAEVFASLSYWYHLPYADICNMPMSAIRQYMDKLKIQRAGMRLMLAEAASVPHMTKESHREWHAEVDKVLNGGKRVLKVLSPAIMSMIGIGFTPRKEDAHG